MPGVRVTVAPEVMQWVLQTAKQQHVDLGTIDIIEKWISGEKTPTFHQLETIGKRTNIPFGYFFLKKPPQESCGIVDYRTVDSISVVNPSRNLMDTLDAMTRAQQWMSEYKKDRGYEPCHYVGSMKISHDIEKVSDMLRKELEIDINWFTKYRNADDAFKAWKKKITEMDILVMMNGVVGNNTHRKLSVNEFRAFTLIDEYAPLIFINTADSKNGKLFSILHEFVHVLLGKNSFYNDEYGTNMYNSAEERFCNAVAAEILVPKRLFIVQWKQYSTETKDIVAALRQEYICSDFVLVRRALDCGLISREEYSRLVKLYEKRYVEYLKSLPAGGSGNFYSTLKSRWDPNFVRALGSSVQSGRTQYLEAYNLTNTTGRTFAALTEPIGGYDVG